MTVNFELTLTYESDIGYGRSSSTSLVTLRSGLSVSYFFRFNELGHMEAYVSDSMA